ncbi:MAG: amidohydrolase family protein [Holophaga sp.]|nr:amidohydrolase family protein [Holophaga sp.]
MDVPWLYDRHSHVSLYAALQGCPDLSGCTPEAALALLRGLPEDRVTTVVGWHSSRLKFGPELETLPPAILINFSLHGFALTAGARRILGPAHPELLERQGDPEWCERNMERLLAFFGQSAGLTAAKLDAFMTGLQRVGIGAVEDMLLIGEPALQVIQASPWNGRIRCWTTPAIYRTLSPSAQDAVAGLKLFTDGALGARTAAMDGTFLGGGEGLLIYTGASLEQELADLQPLGKPLAIHAIGGRAVGQTLAALERLAAQNLTLPWVRMEHVQFITLEQARRAKALGVILSMQPNFNSDSVDYTDRLAPADLEANNPFRMLLDQAGFRCGEDLIFGSDGMPHGVEYAFQWSLFPPFPGQRLTVEELVAGYGLPPEGQGESTLSVDDGQRKVRLLRSQEAAASKSPSNLGKLLE